MWQTKEEIDKDTEIIEKKTKGLHFLYLYHKKYDEETPEQKRRIRNYYETELRYKGSFYRDKKQFRLYGNPKDWEIEKIQRFNIKEETEPYHDGMKIFKDFKYSSTNLVSLELSYEMNLLLLYRNEYKELEVNSFWKSRVNNEIKEMFSVFHGIDRTTENARIKKGFNPSKVYDLKDKQIKFKLQVDDYIRYISTPFLSEHELLTVGVAEKTLEDFLNTITGIEVSRREDEFINPSTEFEEGYKVDSCRLLTMYVIKYTHTYDRKYYTRDYGKYDLTVRELVSLNIEHLFR